MALPLVWVAAIKIFCLPNLPEMSRVLPKLMHYRGTFLLTFASSEDVMISGFGKFSVGKRMIGDWEM
jgi:hypothetical protein